MKKRLTLVLAVLMAVSLFTGCGTSTTEPTAPTSPATSEQPAGSSTPAPTESVSKHVKNLVIGTTTTNDVFNLYSQSGAFGRLNYNCVANAYIAYIDNAKKIQPYFMKSYEISEDGCELTFVYPTDKVFHDGTPVTAEDIEFTFKYYRDVVKNSYIKTLDTVTVDEASSTIVLKFSKADAYSYMANGATSQSILPKHIWENVETPKEFVDDKAAIGCGPYKLVSYDVDAGISQYEAVPENNYLGEIMVDSITVKCYGSDDAMLMAMLNGEIDTMYNYASPISYTLLDLISGDANIDSGASPYAGNYQICFGMEEGRFFTDHAAREALIKAIDWNLMCQIINGEYGQIPGAGIITPSCKGFDPSLPTFYQDIAEANKLLDDAGYADINGDGIRENKDGSELTVHITPQFSAKKKELLDRIAAVLGDALKNLGLASTVDSYPSSEAWEKEIVDGNYDMNIGYTTSGVAQYRTCFRYFVADVLPDDVENTAGSTWIWGTNHDPKLTEEAWGITYSKNEAEYLEHIQTLQKMAADDLFAFALCWEQCFFPYRTDKCANFDNWSGIGVINPETWFTISAK